MEQNTTNITLTPAEKPLASRIQFDEQVLRAVKSAVGRDIEPYEQDYPSSDGSVYKYVCGADEEAEGKGFTVKISDVYDNGSWRVGELQNVREVLPAGYSAFQTEDMCYRSGVTILKTTDPYDIIRLHRTQGWNFDDRHYGTEVLIQVIEAWQQMCHLNVIGAGSSDVKIIMETLPDDLVAFAEKVNFLCWELDQINNFGGYGQSKAENRVVAEKLAAHLRETRRLYLWWD